ncbi:lysozyme inhibitor LprI family protein [Pseudomonas matsuisoli]|uniref:Lysozyme inhibitor LprI-like N-terminal domain-containing protein n=1 Tax=Pseudomonas matsuisoli TaxID=1515666 RepID=A0A917PXK9_9PSED|nr:hypothetical protein GCM10009304_25790 [Pseudomonas matsuisoli]
MLSLGATSASAYQACKDIATSQQFLECSLERKEESDKKLNFAYRRLIKNIKTQYSNNSNSLAEYLSKIKNSQRAWITLRNENCALESFEIEEQSQAHVTTLNNCEARMSKERTEYLIKTLGD